MHERELSEDVDYYSPTIGDFDRLTQKINENPKNAIILRNRGAAYYWSQLEKSHDLALQDYDKALAMEHTKANWYDERASILKYLDRDAEALKDSDSAIRLDGETATYYATRASIYDDLGKSEEACRDYAKAAKLDPSSYALDWATALVTCGRDDDALTVLNQLTSRDKDPNGYEPMISIYMRQGKFELAHKAVNDWKADAPDSSEAYECSAKMLESFGEKAEAQADYRQLIKMFTEKDASHYDWSDRADYFDKLNQPDQAREARRKAVALYQKDSSADLSSQADEYEKMGDNEKAKELRMRDLETSEKEIAKSPDSADAYHSRAKSFEELDKNEEALRDFKHASELEPNNTHYSAHHADRLNALARYKEAIAEGETVLKQHPHDMDTLMFSAMAEASEKLGTHKTTVEYCNTWLKNEKNDGDAYYWRSQAYRALGKNELANRDAILSKWFGGFAQEDASS